MPPAPPHILRGARYKLLLFSRRYPSIKKYSHKAGFLKCVYTKNTSKLPFILHSLPPSLLHQCDDSTDAVVAVVEKKSLKVLVVAIVSVCDSSTTVLLLIVKIL